MMQGYIRKKIKNYNDIKSSFYKLIKSYKLLGLNQIIKGNQII